MEKFREALKRRMRFGGLYCCFMMFPNVILNHLFGGEPFTHFIMGAMIASEAMIIGLITAYGFALKNEDYLRKLYIKENDERRHFIKSKAAVTGIKVLLAGLFLAMMISGYFSKTVFFTLFGVEIFIALIMLSLKFYYNDKI